MNKETDRDPSISKKKQTKYYKYKIIVFSIALYNFFDSE